MRHLLWTCLLAGLVCGSGAAADETAGTSLIRMQSRFFDMRVDPQRVRRHGHFIPINRVQWIQDVLFADPYLKFTVIHIQDRQTEMGVLIRQADLMDELRSGPEVPQELQLPGYDVFWRNTKSRGSSGSIIYFPKDDPYSFHFSCAYYKSEGWPGYCGMLVSYPPEPLIRIRVRVYKVTRPFNDFREMAHRARALVSCLDVTEALQAGTWMPAPVESGALPSDLRNCLAERI